LHRVGTGFDGYLPNANSEDRVSFIYFRVHLDLALGPDGSVFTLGATLPKAPLFARTQEEYDATDLYEIVWTGAAKICPTLSHDQVAKWFENTINLHAKRGPLQHWSEPERERTRDVLVFKTNLSGSSFNFHSSLRTRALWWDDDYDTVKLFGQYAE
jgi:hypothetical protein